MIIIIFRTIDIKIKQCFTPLLESVERSKEEREVEETRTERSRAARSGERAEERDGQRGYA